MLTLLLGTDWVANRTEILNRIARDVREEKAGRILMVPELISHDTERRLCAAAGDTCSRFAEVLSFTRLAKRVADTVGHAAQECLDNGGRVVAMASAVRQLHSKLKAYASVETNPEFLSGLVDAVDEFKRCCITADDLSAASRNTEGSLAQKLEELSLILSAYDSLCAQGKRDPRDQMTWLLEVLESGSFGQEHVFYIDGFPDFTRQHMEIIKHLTGVSDNVTVSLNCDKPGSGAVAFEKAGATAAELLRYAKQRDLPVDICYVTPRQDGLTSVRERLFQGQIREAEASDVVKVYRTETVHQECSAAVEQVLTLVHKGARFRDISVVCGDFELYRNTLETVFYRSGVPVYLSGTEDVLDKSVVNTVLSAMDAALNGFDRQDVFKYIKSALSPLDLKDGDRFENYTILWDVDGNRWHQEWTGHPNGLGQTWDESSKETLDQLNRLRSTVIGPLLDLRNGFRDAVNVGQQVQALYSFFEAISLSKRLSELALELDENGDNRNAQILNQLWDILLTALEQMYDILGNTAWNAENFTRLFKLLLTQYDVGTIPPVLDSVTVGPVSAMRCQQPKHLLVLGALEGALPGYSGSGGILTDQERNTLRQIGVPLTGGAMEGLQAEFAEIYGVFCGAEQTITVCCPSGQPSFLYRRLCELAGEEIHVKNCLGPALGSRQEATAYLARLGDRHAASSLQILEEYEKLLNRRNHTLGNITHDNVRKLYGNTLNLSASQIDRQAECRLSYFLKYGLRAKERKTAQIDPAEFGTYVHAVLENTVKEIMESGGFRCVNLDQTLLIARRHSESYAKERFADIGTERLNYLFKRNVKELELIVQELWKEFQECSFVPVGFEVAFGDGGEVPAIDVSGKQMQAKLRGFVDRVDAWENNGEQYFRVVDYKTGKKDFDYCDIYNGYGLQMLLYLFALEQEGQSVLSTSAIPAGVQYFPARVPMVPADGLLTEDEADTMREKLWKRKGLLLEQEQVLYAMENSDFPKRLPVNVKKDGTLTGDLADRRQFALLKTFVFSLVGKMVDDIASGCVEPNPYTRGSSHDACAYCPYSSVCHEQTVTGRRNYKAMTGQQFWEDVEKEMDRHG